MLNEDLLGVILITCIWLMIDPNIGDALTDKSELLIITSPSCTVVIYIPVYRVVLFLLAGVRIFHRSHEWQR